MSQGGRWVFPVPEPSAMREPKVSPAAVRFDVIAFVMLTVGLLVAACVVSHDPGRAPENSFPAQFNSDNLLGAPGSTLR